MERLSMLMHNNRKLAFLDCKNLNEKEIVVWIDKLADFTIKNKIRLNILDVTGTHTTPKVKEAASEAVRKSTAELGKIYTALIGLSALQRIIANVISRDNYFASDLDDAKKWLLSKDV